MPLRIGQVRHRGNGRRAALAVAVQVPRRRRAARVVHRCGDVFLWQQLAFVHCSRDHGGLILARASTHPRVPILDTLTSYPVFLPGYELARPGLHDGVYYDEPEELRGLRPSRTPR